MFMCASISPFFRCSSGSAEIVDASAFVVSAIDASAFDPSLIASIFSRYLRR